MTGAQCWKQSKRAGDYSCDPVGCFFASSRDYRTTSGNQFHQFRRLHSQRACQCDDVEQADITFPALDSPDVITVQVGHLRERFLGKTAFQPQVADAFAKNSARVGGSHLKAMVRPGTL
jgi:hypothetical protein